MNQELNAATVLVCPLSWGYGHVSRCIPIVEKLCQHNVLVVFAVSKYQSKNLNLSFNNLIIEQINGFNLTYSKNIPVWLMVLLQIPKIICSQFNDRLKIKKLIKKYNVDRVISDNHYACIFKRIPSVFLTHQLNVCLPKIFRLFEPLFFRFHKLFYKNAQEIWIPDFEAIENFTGTLTHLKTKKKNTFFIGILSQFQTLANCNPSKIKTDFDLLIFLSGQEPQRSHLENILISKTVALNLKVVLIRGSSNKSIINKENFTVFDFANPQEIKDMVSRSKYIICRSGYSTIMDLVFLNRTALLIPTPGQTEQEYLAAYLTNNKYFYYQNQNEIDLLKGFSMLDNLTVNTWKFNSDILNQRIKKFILGMV